MSIKEMKANGTVTVCCTACATDFDVAPGAVVLGRSRPGNKVDAADPDPPPITDPNMIDMPPCPSCGAEIAYQQNFDAIPAEWVGTGFDLRRRAVNAYAKKLKSLGRKHEHCAAKIDAQTDPTDLMPEAAVKNIPAAVKRKHRER